MIGAKAPYVRLRRPNIIKVQSGQFISPHGRHPSLSNPRQPPPRALLSKYDALAPLTPSTSAAASPEGSSSGEQAPTQLLGQAPEQTSLRGPGIGHDGRPSRVGGVGVGQKWGGQTLLSYWLKTYAHSYRPRNDDGEVQQKRSPFLPIRVEKATGVRWQAPKYLAKDKARLCKEAFLWRLNFAVASFKPDFSASTFSWGGVERDPIPDVIQLLGGEKALTATERRQLGLKRKDGQDWGGDEERTPLTTIARRKLHKVVETMPDDSTASPSLTSSTSSSSSPHHRAWNDLEFIPGTGYLGDRAAKNRDNPFKGKLSERTRMQRIAKVAERMKGMDERVQQFKAVCSLPALLRLEADFEWFVGRQGSKGESQAFVTVLIRSNPRRQLHMQWSGLHHPALTKVY